jgi:hypothetical protein
MREFPVVKFPFIPLKNHRFQSVINIWMLFSTPKLAVFPCLIFTTNSNHPASQPTD